MHAAPVPTEVRVVDLAGVLSLVSDLGMGQPMEHALRQCIVAMRLGDRVGLAEEQREAVFYAGLLAWVGCHVDAYEQAKWFGDDLALKADFRSVDARNTLADMSFMLRRLGSGRPTLERLRIAMTFFGQGLKDADGMLSTHCAAADGLAAGFGLSDVVRTAIEQTFERWDGRGDPHGARGEDILMASRLVNLADVTVVFHGLGGVDAAVEVARERSGTQFDPAIVDLLSECAGELLGDLDDLDTWDFVVGHAPDDGGHLDEAALDDALEAIADFTDVKSPYTAGHSRGVADLAGAAADGLGLSADDVTRTRRAGLLHDLGRLGVPNTIWDKQTPLSIGEIERVRMHPYLTERTLASSPLASLGALAMQHHERLDGSGYPRGIHGDAIDQAGRVLAAADMYRAKIEPRPHRDAVTASTAASIVRGEVRQGRLDGEAVEAVLRTAGHRPRRAESVAGLTPREIEVLRLLAQGLATKQIARRLGIAQKTAGNHIEHIYTKLDVSNRALATLFAARHGLLDPGAEPETQDRGLA